MYGGLRRLTNYPSPAQCHGHADYSDLLHQDWTHLTNIQTDMLRSLAIVFSGGARPTPASDLRRTFYDVAIEFVM
jgi:hypothetical protein